ncbi:MAG TPA: hypothetical protein VJR90_01070 [Gammaproteobacteria bacterium]|nr:hypothetical protein [Gammaproteobacteria bacterium]
MNQPRQQQPQPPQPQQRQPRELESREETAREEYAPPSTLPVPKHTPGYVFHWVATHIMGAADPTNVSKKLREGWVPVKAADHPELQLAPSANGNVEIGGLMLCKMPVERARARSDYYAAQSRQQMQSVDAGLMRHNDPRMPLSIDRRSKTTRGETFGNGT